ncbi:MAG: hypothetical protein AAFN59_13245 [Pseudomonadota bacterium]
MTRISIGFLVMALVACAPEAPDDVVQGVGFDDPTTLEARNDRDAELAGDPVPDGPVIGDETAGNVSLPGDEGTVAVAPGGNPGISDEQDFDAVAGRESIESDRERLERLRQEYQVVETEALPTRPGSGEPNIVAFALSTTNRVGEQVYARSSIGGAARFTRNCGRYGSADQAQLAFLEAGGPERDRRGVDPDGDGFACFWDPAPFRAARSN